MPVTSGWRSAAPPTARDDVAAALLLAAGAFARAGSPGEEAAEDVEVFIARLIERARRERRPPRTWRCVHSAMTRVMAHPAGASCGHFLKKRLPFRIYASTVALIMKLARNMLAGTMGSGKPT